MKFDGTERTNKLKRLALLISSCDSIYDKENPCKPKSTGADIEKFRCDCFNLCLRVFRVSNLYFRDGFRVHHPASLDELHVDFHNKVGCSYHRFVLH